MVLGAYTNKSKCKTFNTIADIAKSKGYGVRFFEDMRCGDRRSFIFILKNENLCLSIYFEKYPTMGFGMPAHFELYDTEDTKIFLLDQKEDLINRVKELI
ncbi:hypothetical protein LZ906_017530 (plasmid) [Paraclostridium ghonii]|uniref:hypothetical protein n=1 Tax=Paraclostridium ghonii TaxID=29358 RepID=UPI00202CDA0E|nr:hypothetical protein [Paeniclostridium ghonii]MCM0166540.1 hypothetical protein [Paeniclostridium ghonii]